jgi:hypothetical protein
MRKEVSATLANLGRRDTPELIGVLDCEIREAVQALCGIKGAHLLPSRALERDCDLVGGAGSGMEPPRRKASQEANVVARTLSGSASASKAAGAMLAASGEVNSLGTVWI